MDDTTDTIEDMEKNFARLLPPLKSHCGTEELAPVGSTNEHAKPVQDVGSAHSGFDDNVIDTDNVGSDNNSPTDKALCETQIREQCREHGAEEIPLKSHCGTEELAPVGSTNEHAKPVQDVGSAHSGSDGDFSDADVVGSDNNSPTDKALCETQIREQCREHGAEEIPLKSHCGTEELAPVGSTNEHAKPVQDVGSAHSGFDDNVIDSEIREQCREHGAEEIPLKSHRETEEHAPVGSTNEHAKPVQDVGSEHSGSDGDFSDADVVGFDNESCVYVVSGDKAQCETRIHEHCREHGADGICEVLFTWGYKQQLIGKTIHFRLKNQNLIFASAKVVQIERAQNSGGTQKNAFVRSKSGQKLSHSSQTYAGDRLWVWRLSDVVILPTLLVVDSGTLLRRFNVLKRSDLSLQEVENVPHIPDLNLEMTARYFIQRMSNEDVCKLKATLKQWDGGILRIGTTCSGTDICVPVVQKTLKVLCELFDAS